MSADQKLGSVATGLVDDIDMTTGRFPTITRVFGGCAALLSGRRNTSAHPDAEADERLVTIEEFAAEFDHVLIRKRLLTGAQRALIDGGTRSRGVVTGLSATGSGREMQLDLMVTRPDGRQFPARETAVIPASALSKMAPGSVIDAYYRPGDHSIIAVRACSD
ncbi:hypothetical protein DE4585_02392 [Mycobacteroides salmoniphilum]|uniref:Uncharacterized protein n=1 Tax=Mycobacteroides salmoniphilum TaxID=404941 RepID=A0A4R8S304_9MYCO|nr:hypothetical protein DE4586_03907 [Mycobacteroides salmoniphilum]TDZ83585.1 hypothetical protein DE4585_02392 [Mycobacteroides salmoniphilum]TDZ84519.1 hypothetical protein DE4587_03445 [Mycobacteroides salmoniphilum]